MFSTSVNIKSKPSQAFVKRKNQMPSDSFFSQGNFFQPKLPIGLSDDRNEKKAEASVNQVMRPDHKGYQEKRLLDPSSTDGIPDVQKQEEGGVPTATPCPSSVGIGTLAPFNHSNLPAAEKDNWGTYLGVASQMTVGPGPDHTGYCMKESLTTISNNCPEQVYQRGGRRIEPCTGNKCLDINRYGNAGDSLTRSMTSDSPTAFLDLHRTRSRTSLLEGSVVNSCSVVCEQTYTCDRTHATTGTFRITREYQAGTHTKADQTTMHITTGNVRKERVP